MYEPNQYWNKRHAEQGDLYVTHAGRDRDFFERQAALFMIAMDVRPCGRLLDLGCGVGRLQRYLQEFCKQYVGVDIVDHGERIRSQGGEFFHQTPWAQLEIEPCDALVAATVFQHMPPEHFERACADIRRWIKPGGRVYIIDDAGPAQAAHMFVRSPDDLVRLIGLDRVVMRRLSADREDSHNVITGELR